MGESTVLQAMGWPFRYSLKFQGAFSRPDQSADSLFGRAIEFVSPLDPITRLQRSHSDSLPDFSTNHRSRSTICQHSPFAATSSPDAIPYFQESSLSCPFTHRPPELLRSGNRRFQSV